MALTDTVDPVAFGAFLEGLRNGNPIRPTEVQATIAKLTRLSSPVASFDLCCDRLLGSEGGYVNNPNDPGGETKFGISKRSYPSVDIYNLTRESAQLIYKNDFWSRINADKLPASVAFQLFDFAVNSGIETAVRHLQKAINVADDGHWGPHSQEAADATSETDMIMNLNAERLDFMRKLKNWPNAGSGWAGRIANNLRYGAQDT